jgi:hypothetical protein
MALQDYVPTEWVNGTLPAINATNLNHIEEGIDLVTDAVINLESTLPEDADLVHTIPASTIEKSVPNMVWMTQSDYESITPDPNTLYIIKG